MKSSFASALWTKLNSKALLRTAFKTSLAMILSTNAVAGTVANSSITPSETVPTLADNQMFRKIFAAALTEAQGGKSPSAEQLNHLLYLSKQEMFDEAAFTGNDGSCQISTAKGGFQEIQARETLCRMANVYGKISPEKLYQLGVRATAQTANEQALDLTTLNARLRDQDLMVVIVPGIFGEFIEKRAFEEVFPVRNADGSFTNDSAFAREWRAAMAEKTEQEIGASSCASIDPNSVSVCDNQEKLVNLSLEKGNKGERSVSMLDLMNTGSIDDAYGNPLVRVALFQMDGMTLESLGEGQKNAQTFTRRLEKLFKITGHTPKNIAFVGYSRGTAFALEMLSQAKAARKPWLNNVKALVSLGGVVFGSALADDAIVNTSSKVNRQLQQLDILKSSLTELPDLTKAPHEGANLQWFGLNTLAWWKFAIAAGKIQSEDSQKPTLGLGTLKDQLESVQNYLLKLQNDRGTVDPSFGVKMVTEQTAKFGLLPIQDWASNLNRLQDALQAVTKGDLSKLVELAQAQMKSSPQKDGEPNARTVKYNTDIKRFRKLATAAKQGVIELTTDNRLSWWRTHQVPLHVRYYSVSGTMAPAASELMKNRWAYNPGSPDDQGLIQNWTDYSKVGIAPEYQGVALNDSQVAIYKTSFWPEMIESLNWKNAGLRTTPLAVLGTHHWGMALPIVTQIKRIGPEGTSEGLMLKNPFPRAVLMHSLALTIANDIRVDQGK